MNIYIQGYVIEKITVSLFRGQLFPFNLFFQHARIVLERFYQNDEWHE